MQTQVNIEEKESWVRKLDIEVPAEDVDNVFAEVSQKYRANVEIPGFRKGKAPLEMVRARFGQAIKQDALEQLLPSAYDQAVKEHNLVPIGDPSISDVVFEKSKPLSFTVEITVRPEVEVNNYQGLKLTKKTFEITDEDVNGAIEHFREVRADLVDVTRPLEEGDIAICDLQVIREKLNRIKEDKFEGQIVDLTDERCAPEFIRQMPGMRIGEGQEIEVTYPPDQPKPEFAGNTVLYRVWVKEIKQKNLPEVNDEFARDIGPFEDLADMKAKVRADIERNVNRESMKELQEQARQAVVEANKFEVPSTILDSYLDSVERHFEELGSENLDRERIRMEFRPMAEEQFRWDFIMHEIAEKENLTVTNEEVRSLKQVIEENQAKSDTDKQEDLDPERLRTRMLEQKVLDLLIEKAEVEEVSRVLSSRIVQP